MKWKIILIIDILLILIGVGIFLTAQTSNDGKIVHYPGEIKGSESNLTLLYHFNNESRFGENDTHVYDFSGNGNNGSAMIKMEAGTTGDVVNDSWFTVNLQNTYDDPVVIAQPPSYDGGGEAVVRIRNVSSNSFEMRIQEPSNKDDTHTTETVNYIVIEAGKWRLPDGRMIEAGKITTNATRSGEGASFENWEKISYSHSYSSAPVVITQVMTYNDANFVKTRQVDVNTLTFNVTMEEEGNSTTSHGTETIGWIAVEKGTGEIDGIIGILYEFGNTTDSVEGLDNGWYRQNFSQSFSSTPLFIGWMQTTDGGDSSGVRYKDLDSSGVNLIIEEDTTYDDEKSHATEIVGYLVFENPNLIASYHLDYGSGSTAIDSTLFHNNGDIYGATWTSGKFGDYALEFDGVDDYVALPMSYNSTNIGSFSVSAWVKIPTDGGDWSIVDFDRSEYYTATAGIPSDSYNGEGDYVGFHTTNSTGTTSDMWSNSKVRDETWHHIAWVYDASIGKKYIYIDGVLDNTQEVEDVGTGVTRYGFLGDGSEASTFNGSRNEVYFKGTMDEVRIYEQALTQQEIEDLISTSSHSLFSINRPQFTSSNNGKLGLGAFEFDGTTGNCLAINKCYGANSISEITVCAWVKSSSSKKQIIASFDRSENWRLALKDETGTGNVGWDTTDSAGTTDDLGTSQDYADGNWHYICGWFDAEASPDKKIYVDGQVVNSTTAHGGNNLGEGAERTCTYGFVGTGSEAEVFDGDKSPMRWFNGQIDELVIFERALSDPEIYDNYMKGLSCHYNGSGDWKLEVYDSYELLCEGSEVTINLNGDVYISNMTTLKLNNTVLNFSSSPSKIHIKQGGKFKILGKTTLR